MDQINSSLPVNKSFIQNTCVTKDQLSNSIDSKSELTVATSLAINTLKNQSLTYMGEVSWDGFNYTTGIWVTNGGSANPTGTSNRGTLFMFGGGDTDNTAALWRYAAIYLDINGVVAVHSRAGDSAWPGWKVLNGPPVITQGTVSSSLFSSANCYFHKSGNIVTMRYYGNVTGEWAKGVSRLFSTIPSNYAPNHNYYQIMPTASSGTYSLQIIPSTGVNMVANSQITSGSNIAGIMTWQTNNWGV